MVDFSLTPEQQELVKLAEKFARTEILPVAAKYDRSDEFPSEVVKRAFELGLMNVSIPEEYGGLGLGALDMCLITEELAAACPGITSVIFGNELGLAPIILDGSEEQKKRFLPMFTERPLLCSFALTEPGAGSDIAAVATTAERDGDGYILNGTKRFITNGPHASLYIVFATHDPSLRHKGLSAFIVERETDGVSSGKEEDKLGMRASATSEIILDNVRLPASNLLGGQGDGFKVAMRTLDRTRAGIGAFGVGVARAALDTSLQYALQREQFGQRIANFQAIQFKLADMAKDMEAARLLVRYSAWLVDQGRRATKETSMAKCMATDVAMRSAVEAVQVHGGYGYIKEFPVEKMMRDAKLLQIFEGTNEIQRLVIARELIRSVTTE